MAIWLLIVGLALLTLAIAGVSFTLLLLPGIVVREWLQNHPELIAQNGKRAIPPEFVADIRRAQTLNMLRRRDKGDFSPLIEMYEQLVGRVQPDKYPLFYTSVQNDLGTAYYERSTRYQPSASEQGLNVERAIASHQQALTLLTPEAAPFEYASAQAHLGTAYQGRLTGDRQANLEQAIACYQRALCFMADSAPSKYYMRTEYTRTLYNVGLAYSDLKGGDRTANLQRAIARYQEALRFWTPETAPLGYAMLQYQLGLAYSGLLVGDRTANLQRAIACYQEALRFWTPETAPLDYARTQRCLGAAYYDLPGGDRTANLQRAIACDQEALRFLSEQTLPIEYAFTQSSLGTVYGALSTGDRIANLERAIAYHQQALRFLTVETAPRDYALAQNNLGAAYRNLPIGDRTANLQRAIACYQRALRIWTPEADPHGYATAQNNLGIAYSYLLKGDRAANLEQAIACYQQALRFRTPESDPYDYALTQHNLGIAYSNLPTGDRMANLQRAIACYQQALRFWTPEAAPLDYALTQNALGEAYRKLPTGDRTASLQRAIACYQQALRFWTPEADPHGYATAQNNQGNAYSECPTGHREADLERAIACYQQTLRFWTAETAPELCRIANRNLANLYFQRGEWEAAFQAYDAAIAAGERLYRAGLSAESKAIETAENIVLYRRAAFSAYQSGNTVEAFLTLERGKTRLLVEALHLRVRRPAGIPDEIWHAFESASAAVRATLTGEAPRLDEGRDERQYYTVHEQLIRAANAALDKAIECIQVYAPKFLQPLDSSELPTLLPDERTALVAFCITDQGSIGFVTTAQDGPSIRAIEVPAFTRPTLNRLFRAWETAYQRYRSERSPMALTAWQEIMTRVLSQLSHDLLEPIFSAFPSHIEHLVFLPSGELFLLPLHAAPLPSSPSSLVCDRYRVSYAPSVEVLAETQAKSRKGGVPELYAVIAPRANPDLPFMPVEGKAIARSFPQQTVDSGQEGTKNRVITRARGRAYVHFCCCGSYDWNNPLASGLELADGHLTLEELQRDGEVDLSSARLVTLSACETGMIDILKGNAEEYVGVPAGFLMAGVPCVVSSLWAVPDLATALLMERFYSNRLSGGMPIVMALSEAQSWLRTVGVGELVQYAERCYQQSHWSDKPQLFRLMRYYRQRAEHDPLWHPFAHPYYWAAFTVNGW